MKGKNKGRSQRCTGYHYRPAEQLKRNSLTVRLSDEEHKTISFASWKQHVSASRMCREIIMSYLKKE